MNPFLSFLGKYEEKIEIWSNLTSTWLIIFLMLLIVSEVVYRYVVGKAILGAYNLAEMMMVGVCFLGLAYTQNKKGHIRMGLVLQQLEKKSFKTYLFTETASLFLCLVISILLFYQSLVEAQVAINIRLSTAGIIKWPAWPLKIAVAFGFLLLSIRIAIQIGRQIWHLISYIWKGGS